MVETERPFIAPVDGSHMAPEPQFGGIARQLCARPGFGFFFAVP
jgi:hypothetical protein